MTLLASQVDALAQKLERLSTSPIPGSLPEPSVRVHVIYETCGVQENTSIECYNGPSTIEYANAL